MTAVEPFTRTVFATSRAAEFLQPRALQAQTGQPVGRFGDVVVKELLDNALDAAESAGLAPEITLTIADVDGHVAVTVTDNGPGIPVDVITRLLDFDVLVSDKAAYRSPTRGAQGNAFKTLLGIPHALGVAAPVVIEAHGIRHEIAVSLDPGGNVVIRHDQDQSTRTAGTSVMVPVAVDPADAGWLQKFAAVNPHANLTLLDFLDGVETAEIYKPTVGDGWRKPTPNQPVSPWWFSEGALKQLVFAHVGAARAGGRDVPLGEFVRGFAGLSNTAKARAVAAAVPEVKTLADFADRADRVGVLLDALQAAAKRPKPAGLGKVGRDHLVAHLDRAYGVERDWYQYRSADADGVGWAIEIAVAETSAPGSITYATNFSPAFGDPLRGTRLVTDDVTAEGVASFLHRCDAYPDLYSGRAPRAVVVHVMCAAPEFTDKGKVMLTVPPEVADVFADALGKATRTLRIEHARAERDALAADRDRQRAARRAERQADTERPTPTTLKDAVFAVMDEAIAEASAGGTLPFPTRNLLYSVRPRIQRYTEAELKMNYFGQTLVVEWEREHGPIPGHYRDPRGELREPHSGTTVRLGTREIAAYTLPRNRFNKILYVEKEGLNPIFEAVQLAERFDMAIASGKGQPVEAVRDLFARAGAGNYRLFVLHDADHAGYVIRRAIAEETARMPQHRVEVIDLGLTVADAIALDLPTERYIRRNDLPHWMADRLTDDERAWFEGRPIGRKQFECTRVELNALGSTGLVDLIETGLRRHRAATKVIPSSADIAWYGQDAVSNIVHDVAENAFKELGLDIDEITRRVASMYDKKPSIIRVKQSTINRRLRGNSKKPWTTPVYREVRRRLNLTEIDARIRATIAERIEARQREITP